MNFAILTSYKVRKYIEDAQYDIEQLEKKKTEAKGLRERNIFQARILNRHSIIKRLKEKL